MSRPKVAILGSGNIGTDLMIKILERSSSLEMSLMIGINENSDGLAKAKSRGLKTSHLGIAALEKYDVDLVFDATSAAAHEHHARVLEAKNIPVIDLTPAALGPYVVPVANLEAHLDAVNVNMVTCGGQATIPMVYAVSQVSKRTPYAEIIASIASKSAGPGTRANIDEFTVTTARGIEQIGGAEKGKAIIVLNPAEPALVMRDTVYILAEGIDEVEAAKSIHRMVSAVQKYFPGYRLVQEPQFEEQAEGQTKVTIFLEVEGAGDYLPKYAGNLDIMTSAALAVGEKIAERLDG